MTPNKTVFITGASRGIGRAIAIRFAAAGYQLALCCRQNTQLLEDLQQLIISQYHTDCLIFTGDTGDYRQLEAMISETIARFHHIDVLVNNAGISYIGLLTDMSPDDWQRIVNPNLTSVFNSCRLAVPGMVHEHSGKIINISSVWGCCGASCEVAYSATKGGINAFTKAMAKELGPSHIRVNAISCGVIDTEMNACFSEDERQALADEIPLMRFGQPEEVAELAVFLADRRASFLTGKIITLDGGML